jgi:hypothetical protein
MDGWIINIVDMSDYTHVEGSEGHIRNTAIPTILPPHLALQPQWAYAYVHELLRSLRFF